MIQKRKKNLIILLLVLLLTFLLFLPSKSYAVLQANGPGSTSYTIDNWMLKVRQMEKQGGTLAKNEEINTSSTDGQRLLPTTENNGLDCHMQKNSEYGALVLLSASGYGNPAKIVSGDTTTGNCTGVYMDLSYELVSAGNVTGASNYNNASPRYKDLYYETISSKNGDALVETKGWHGGTSEWFRDAGYGDAYYWTSIYPNYTHATFLRASGSVFGYYGVYSHYEGYKTSGYGVAHYEQSHPTRAVVVVGRNF